MITPFSLLFLMALLSIALHRSISLKLLSLLSLLGAFYMTLQGIGVPLSGFALNSSTQLFELIVEIVLFALILHEKEDITITQTLFIGSASLLMLESNNLLTFIISFEALSIISVVLVSFIQTKEEANGAIKMFIASAISTAIIFLGVFFYILGGAELLLPLKTTTNSFETFGVFVIFVGIFYKLTIVPFHSWSIDTYALVRHSNGAILSGVAKTVVVVSAFNLFSPFISTHLDFSVILLSTLSIITMTFGNFMALFEQRLSKILAYSSIAHAGYMLLAFIAIKSSFASIGLTYMAIAYIFMQTASFLVLDILRKTYNIKTLEDLKGFKRQNPLLSLLFTIQIFSLAGIPLLAGFLAKAVLFYSIVDAGYWYIVLIALLNSALSVGYYAWIIKAIYFDKKESKTKELVSIELPILAQIILVIGTLYFGIFAWVLFL